MIFDEIISYNRVLELSERATRSLLTGNGFSIALFPQIFSYDRLYEHARVGMSEELRRLFDALGTRDFERVMHLLGSSEVVIDKFLGDPRTAGMVKSERLQLREMLVSAIAESHPESHNAISDEVYEICWTFLSAYANLFTLNYDLLLYWVLMWKLERTKDKKQFPFKDAFWNREDERLYWARLNGQAVFYLHGAVHIIRHGHRLHKLNLTDDRRALMAQVNDAIDSGTYPLFVSEASAAAKIGQIKEDSYLDYGYQRLRDLSGELVIFGSSIGAVDDHIWDAVQTSAITSLYVGTRSDQGTQAYSQLRGRVEAALIEPRKRRNQDIDLYFFDSRTATVW